MSSCRAVPRTDSAVLSAWCCTAGPTEGSRTFPKGSEKMKEVEKCNKHVPRLIGSPSGVGRPEGAVPAELQHCSCFTLMPKLCRGVNGQVERALYLGFPELGGRRRRANASPGNQNGQGPPRRCAESALAGWRDC